MTNPNYTHVSFLIDESGSMGSVRDDVIGGFNTLMAEQRKAEGKLTVSVCKFGTHLKNNYELVWDRVVDAEVPDLSADTFAPNGSTPLLDAVGKHINDLGNTLRELPEDERPSTVILVIMTDGRENSSREYSRSQISEMVKRQETEYQWTFVYTGANVDAFAESSSIGISSKNAVGYKSTSAGTRRGYEVLSKNLLRARTIGSAALNKEGFYGDATSVDEVLSDSDPDTSVDSTERI